ncbi:hypothetical protein [Mammaliicoccus lentus]|uniref:hypothetical protein n=1 Tax=Mammaliicoccus lentus TaxID=42858 RepID=UPI002DB8004B|nr:hypothetical protein [Mammaliicoccus lentus]MEB8093134.1 hypothetical protein [Mammaliicoccus lentus]
MCKENNKQNHDNKRSDQLGSGKSNEAKRSNDNVRKTYRNRTSDFQRPSESTMEALFGDEYKNKD